MTLEEAEELVEDFPELYEPQGYYLTARHERIRPEDVELLITGGDLEPVGNKAVVNTHGGR